MSEKYFCPKCNRKSVEIELYNQPVCKDCTIPVNDVIKSRVVLLTFVALLVGLIWFVSRIYGGLCLGLYIIFALYVVHNLVTRTDQHGRYHYPHSIGLIGINVHICRACGHTWEAHFWGWGFLLYEGPPTKIPSHTFVQFLDEADRDGWYLGKRGPPSPTL
jgi:hypothetical protein